MKRLDFNKSKRLGGKGEFEAVLAVRARVSDKLLAVYAAKNDFGRARLGISISRTFGGAVMRNRMKRLIREAFRLNQEKIVGGFDYVVMIAPSFVKSINESAEAKKMFKNLSLAEVQASFLALAGRAAEKSGRY